MASTASGFHRRKGDGGARRAPAQDVEPGLGQVSGAVVGDTRGEFDECLDDRVRADVRVAQQRLGHYQGVDRREPGQLLQDGQGAESIGQGGDIEQGRGPASGADGVGGSEEHAGHRVTMHDLHRPARAHLRACG